MFLETAFVEHDAADLVEARETNEQVDGEQAPVLGDDDQRVARPDEAGGHQRRRLFDADRFDRSC